MPPGEKIINNQEYLINFYNFHHEEIKENFNLALKHKIGEDFLYTKYKDIL